MAITITITDPQDHAPYELRVLAEYFQALANDKQEALKPTPAAVRTTHDEELLSDEERAALHLATAEKPEEHTGVPSAVLSAAYETGRKSAQNGEALEPRFYSVSEAQAEYERGYRDNAGSLRGTAGGDQEPYAVNAGGSDDFAELRDDPKPDASTPAAASDGKTAPADLDSSGLPWDERIHSSSKAQNADGTWRYKRGGDLDERKRVEAELRGNGAGSEANTPATASDLGNADTPGVGTGKDVPPNPFGPDMPLPVEDDIPPPPVEDLPPPPPADEPEPEVNMGIVFKAITDGQKGNLTQDKLAECLKAVGLTSTVDITRAPAEILAPLLQLIKEASV